MPAGVRVQDVHRVRRRDRIHARVRRAGVRHPAGKQVVGSSGKLKYEVRDGKPVLVKLPEIDFVDDGPGKPVGIRAHIGRRPVMCFGNSDGDFHMLQWTTAGPRPRFGLITHHTDGDREWKYDRESHVGKLDKALDAAPRAGWTVVDMKAEWKVIYPFKK